jgi:hypothetical protein
MRYITELERRVAALQGEAGNLNEQFQTLQGSLSKLGQERLTLTSQLDRMAQETSRCDQINTALHSQLMALRTALQSKGLTLPPSCVGDLPPPSLELDTKIVDEVVGTTTDEEAKYATESLITPVL